MALGKKAHAFKTAYLANEHQNPLSHANDYFNDIPRLRQDTDNYFTQLTQYLSTIPNIIIEQHTITIEAHSVKLKVYIPTKLDRLTNTSGIVFHPGGGLLLDMQHLHDRALCLLAKAANTIVISVQPPLSHEKQFLEIANIAYLATKYCYQQAEQLRLGPLKQLVTAGYSLGATLACLVTNRAVSSQDFPIDAQLLISGLFNFSEESQTINKPYLGNATQDFMAYAEAGTLFMQSCLKPGITQSELQQPEYSPYYANLTKVPPTVLIAGGCDALMPSTQTMYQQYKAAGVNSRFIINDAGDIHNAFLLWDLLGDGLHPSITAAKALQQL